MTIQFYQVKENLANVVVNGKNSKFYVEKVKSGYYQIQWGKLDHRMPFIQYASFSKEEIKETLAYLVTQKIERKYNERTFFEYVEIAK